MEETESPPSIKLIKITDEVDPTTAHSAQPKKSQGETSTRKSHGNVVVKVATIAQTSTDGGVISNKPDTQMSVGVDTVAGHRSLPRLQTETVAFKGQPSPSKLIAGQGIQKVVCKAISVNLKTDQSKVMSSKIPPQNIALKVVPASNSNKGKEGVSSIPYQNTGMKIITAPVQTTPVKLVKPMLEKSAGVKIITAPDLAQARPLVSKSLLEGSGMRIVAPAQVASGQDKTVVRSAQEGGAVNIVTKPSPGKVKIDVQEHASVKIIASESDQSMINTISASENSSIRIVPAPKSADSGIAFVKKLQETGGVKVIGTAAGSGSNKTIFNQSSPMKINLTNSPVPAQGKVKKITLGRSELESVGLKVVSPLPGKGNAVTRKDLTGKLPMITTGGPLRTASETPGIKDDKENISVKTFVTSPDKSKVSGKGTGEVGNQLKMIELASSRSKMVNTSDKKLPTKVTVPPQIRCKVMTKGVTESVVLKTVAIKVEDSLKRTRDGKAVNPVASSIQEDKIKTTGKTGVKVAVVPKLHKDKGIVVSQSPEQKVAVKPVVSQSLDDDVMTQADISNRGRKRPLSGEVAARKVPPLTKMVTRKTARECGNSADAQLLDDSKPDKGSGSTERASLKVKGNVADAEKNKKAKIRVIENTPQAIEDPVRVKQELTGEGDSDVSYQADDPEEVTDDDASKECYAGLSAEAEQAEDDDTPFSKDTDDNMEPNLSSTKTVTTTSTSPTKRRKRRGRKRLIHTKKSFRRANYQCEHCDTVCSGKRTLRAHMITHVGAKPFQCNICGATFTLAGNLKTHVMIHTGERPHKCKECGAAFVQAVTLRNHMLTHTGEKPYECPHCHAAFSQAYYLKLHVMTHTGERPHKCKQCDAAFIQSSALKQHMLIHTGEKPHRCQHCDATFRHVNSLKVHYISHTGEKKYKCTYCDMSFSYGGQLKKHMRLHTGENPYKCTKCKATFTSSKKRKEHILTHKDIKLHKCTLCDDAFLSSAILENHIATHLKEKSYECEYCDAEFARSDSLNKHMSKHDPAKDQKCKECDKLFLTATDLKAHIKTHNSQTFARFKESSHRCHLCDAVYMRAENLHKHLAKHDADTDHKCPHCGKSFLLRSDLKIHFMTHTDAKATEKPHKCTHCDEIFIKPTDLRTHIKSHVRVVEKEKRYRCKYCNAGYTRINNYRMHVMKHAGEKVPAKKIKRKKRRKMGAVERGIIQLTQENEEMMHKLVLAVGWTSPP